MHIGTVVWATGALSLPIGIAASSAVQDAERGPGLEQLRILGEIELSANHRSPATIRNVDWFAIDSKERFVFHRWSDASTVVILEGANGEVVTEIPLPDAGMDPQFGLGGERVLATRRASGSRSSSVAFSVLDTGSRAVTEIATDTFDAEDVQGTGLGWLGPDRVLSASSSSLRCWTRAGRLAWSLTPADKLANVSAFCTTTNGLIAILDAGSGRGIQFVYPEGRVGPYVHLDETWGRKDFPRYVLPAENGGLWIAGWTENGMSLVQTDARCRVVQKWIPHYSSGARVDGKLAVGPDGAVWIEDDAAFLRLGPGGIVDRVVGEAREEAPLRWTSMLRIGPDGKIYAASQRDHSVHVFDDTGQKIRAKHPSAYAEDGETPTDLGELEWVEKRWFPVGQSGRHWEVEEDSVRLVDAEGGVIEAYRETDWPAAETAFEAAGVSPEGTLAVALFRETEAEHHRLLHVVLLDPDQAPPRKLRLPSFPWLSSIAYDGKRIAVVNDDLLEIFDAESKSILRADLPGVGFRCGNAPDTTPRIGFVREGTELWFWHGDIGTQITRYAMP